MSLELCECHFDGVEIGAVGRQEQEPGSALLQDRFCFFTFVTGKIVSARTKFVAGMTTSPGVKMGASWVWIYSSKVARFMGLSMTQGAVRPSQRRPAIDKSACPSVRRAPWL